MNIARIEVETYTFWSLIVLCILVGVGCMLWSWAILVGFILGVGCGLLVAFNEMDLEQAEFYRDLTEDDEERK